MNIFKKIYCRTYQLVLKCAMPFLPYREPKLLNDEKEIINILKENSVKKVFIVSSKFLYKHNHIAGLLELLKINEIEYFVFSDVKVNPTIENIECGVKCYQGQCCDVIIAIGGGSVIDFAKGVGARIGNPERSLVKMKGVLKVKKKMPLLIAIPTTAGTGSEATISMVAINEKTKHKFAISDFELQPHYALLNPNLLTTLPKSLTASTGMDALTHAIEAYIGRSATKLTRKYSLKAIKLIFENLFESYQNPNNLEARKNMLNASYLAGLAFSKSYVGYVHAISHSLSGEYNFPHGETNAILLPIVLKKYGKTIYNKLWEIGVYSNLFGNEISKEDGAKKLINIIENLCSKMQIPKVVKCLEGNKISYLSQIAEKEANPLYPVPKLYSAKELETIYLELLND